MYIFSSVIHTCSICYSDIIKISINAIFGRKGVYDMNVDELLETIDHICSDNKHDCHKCELAYTNKYDNPQCYFQFTKPPKLIESRNTIIRICEKYRMEHF